MTDCKVQPKGHNSDSARAEMLDTHTKVFQLYLHPRMPAHVFGRSAPLGPASLSTKVKMKGGGIRKQME